jgi:protein arginine kinase
MPGPADREEAAALAARPAPWLASPGDHGGVVLASRVRLARNLDGWPFPRKLPPARTKQLVERLAEAAARTGDGRLVRIDRLSPAGRQVLVERHLVSRELAGSKRASGLWLSEDQCTALMIGEEDHLRLQVFAPGLDLERLMARALDLDVRLERDLGWAFDERLGYLTACHSNVGTGMRASVMLHLPALAETGELKAVLRALDKLHLAVRGRFGEGSESHGHYYQLSNRRTLGLDEAAIVRLVHEAALRVIEAERVAREALLSGSESRNRLEDKVYRAWAVLSHARSLTSEELIEHLSWLRLGLALDVLNASTVSPRPTWAVLDRIFLRCQPAHLQATYAAAEDNAYRDRLRAELVRSWLHDPAVN